VVKGVLFVFIRTWFPVRGKILKSRAINASCKGKKLKRKIVTVPRDLPGAEREKNGRAADNSLLGGEGLG
jgi:hypothetical protein